MQEVLLKNKEKENVKIVKLKIKMFVCEIT